MRSRSFANIFAISASPRGQSPPFVSSCLRLRPHVSPNGISISHPASRAGGMIDLKADQPMDEGYYQSANKNGICGV